MDAFVAGSRGRPALSFLCPKISLFSPPSHSWFRWLVGAPRVLPPFTVAAVLRPIHGDHDAIDLPREADEIRGLLPRGFDIIGVLLVGGEGSDADVTRALEQARALRELLFGVAASHGLVGGHMDAATGEIRFVVSESGWTNSVEGSVVTWEDEPGRLLWEKGCLLRCELLLKLPLYLRPDVNSGIEGQFSSLIESTVAKLRDPHVYYLVEGPITSSQSHRSIILRGDDLSFDSHTHGNSRTDSCTTSIVTCSEFFTEKRYDLSLTRETADAIAITVNQSAPSLKPGGTPVVEYFPAPASLIVITLKLDILCYSSIDFPVAAAVSELVIPGLADQMIVMKRIIASEITQQAQLQPFHFIPSGWHVPVTAIYNTRYGETEERQSELRKELHLRLGLPLDRPLLRISNALTFGGMGRRKKSMPRSGSSLLRDIHRELPSSGVSGGVMSLIDGSYEYYHYLHDGIDDNGWGCAYRSLQTIVSWYRLQQYSSIDVPSHREIQQVLVEIGDKDPSFIGSCEWIGAIELSFVLDKLLGVSCKVINVRSGDELPEKCRELARHFETQGTPVMIGGGVLAYTLLGVDYNGASGDCAFLILDPHYTGTDDLKKIVNGGWCGWKKSVDSKGRSFFLKDKFYNLLLPQRPNMV
ncbi:probable Ufm1-specific protease isoform X2 [Zea mays]|uniref:probable Ufm1-specific protease isoform X2 n=1 Tax=Zea mays TaxID=4577 RepID=UPI0004DE92E1|nr:probable Ufm1-specific protease isoform X2 [Zea mays]|eukprot:XP_023157745.1 probable Ufm1-specific protease isoform X2 [Zea mays]